MFSVFCRRHLAQVLLGPDNIRAVVNDAGCIELHWHCWCGEDGVERYGPR